MKEEVARVNTFSNALMIVTSIHHIYGAIVYDTPWRLHVLFVSIPVIFLSIMTRWMLSRVTINGQNILIGLYWLLILIFSIILIGGYEGVYNHALKNVLFFSGAGESLLNQMFPPPKYIMPNDFIFEFTGVMQAAIFIPAALRFARFSGEIKKRWR